MEKDGCLVCAVQPLEIGRGMDPGSAPPLRSGFARDDEGEGGGGQPSSLRLRLNPAPARRLPTLRHIAASVYNLFAAPHIDAAATLKCIRFPQPQ